MKKVSTLLVTALIPLFAATMAQSCAGGESVESFPGTGGDNGSSGSNGNGSGGNGSGGDNGSGGANSSSGGSSSSGSGGRGSGGSSSSGSGGRGSGGSSSSGSGGRGSGGSGSGGKGSGGSSSSGSGGSSSSGSGGTTTTSSGGTTGGSCMMVDSTIATNGLAVNGTWMGYAYTYLGSAPASVTPMCGSNASCFSSAMKQLCVSGSVGPDTTYNASAGFGWDIGGTDSTTAKPIAPGGTGLAYDVRGLTTQMRFQIEDGTKTQYCSAVTAAPSGTIPWAMFTKECYKAGGAAYNPTTPISKVQIVVPSDSGTARAFCFCVVSLGPAK